MVFGLFCFRCFVVLLDYVCFGIWMMIWVFRFVVCFAFILVWGYFDLLCFAIWFGDLWCLVVSFDFFCVVMHVWFDC